MSPATIKATREAKGLTQEQAAMLIGSSPRTWQEWEQGRRNMPVSKWALFLIMIGDNHAHA